MNRFFLTVGQHTTSNMQLRNGKITNNRVVRCTSQRVSAPGTKMPKSSVSNYRDDYENTIDSLNGIIYEYEEKYVGTLPKLHGLCEIYTFIVESSEVLKQNKVLFDVFRTTATEMLKAIDKIVLDDPRDRVRQIAKKTSAKIIEFLHEE